MAESSKNRPTVYLKDIHIDAITKFMEEKRVNFSVAVQYCIEETLGPLVPEEIEINGYIYILKGEANGS